MDTLAFPLKFVNGSVQKIVDGSDQYFAQLLAVTIQIKPGELPLTPYYGVEDPAFDDETKSVLASSAAFFIPEIDIQDIQISETDSGFSRLKFSFTVR